MITAVDRAKELQDRTKRFALRIIKMFRSLPRTEEARVMGKQVLRSGTAVAANYRAESPCHPGTTPLRKHQSLGPHTAMGAIDKGSGENGARSTTASGALFSNPFFTHTIPSRAKNQKKRINSGKSNADRSGTGRALLRGMGGRVKRQTVTRFKEVG